MPGADENSVSTVYDIKLKVGCLIGSRLLMPTSASLIRIVFFDTTGCLEGGKWRRIDAKVVFSADVAAHLIVQSSFSFAFLGRL